MFTTQPIKDWFYHKRISQADISRLLKTTPQNISKIFKTKNMGVKTLISLLALTNWEVSLRDCYIEEKKR